VRLKLGSGKNGSETKKMPFSSVSFCIIECSLSSSTASHKMYKKVVDKKRKKGLVGSVVYRKQRIFT
jgi:hypothetical protein